MFLLRLFPWLPDSFDLQFFLRSRGLEYRRHADWTVNGADFDGNGNRSDC